MFDEIKAGYVLRFHTCPSGITSPPTTNTGTAGANALETQWPTIINNIGSITCISKPTGDLDIITSELIGSLNLPAADNLANDRQVGKRSNCKFVGYAPGMSFFTETNEAVVSKDFSGCLMVAYNHNGNRRVAHVAADSGGAWDCKQAFLTARQNAGDTMIGWFRPFKFSRDDNNKGRIGEISNKFYGGPFRHLDLVTFGIITKANHAYSITAFKPTQIVEIDQTSVDSEKTYSLPKTAVRKVLGRRPSITTTTTTTTTTRPYNGITKTWVVVDKQRLNLNTTWDFSQGVN